MVVRTAVLLLFIITSNVFIVFIMRVRRISYFLHARPVRGGGDACVICVYNDILPWCGGEPFFFEISSDRE